jgi:hypothetical protein
MAEARGGLRVPRTPVPVQLSLDNTPARAVELYVAEHLSAAARRQHVIELLVSEDNFVPVRDPSENSWALINKTMIAWVAVSLADPTPSDDAGMENELFDVRRAVVVELGGGNRLTGELLYSPPPTRARVADFLNDSGRFFRLWTNDVVYLVNKRFVARVLEL